MFKRERDVLGFTGFMMSQGKRLISKAACDAKCNEYFIIIIIMRTQNNIPMEIQSKA